VALASLIEITSVCTATPTAARANELLYQTHSALSATLRFCSAESLFQPRARPE
jgi:hypothetical protein